MTVRALATGLALGFVLSFANVYIGLRSGWFFSMALVAGMLAFGAWRGLAAIGLARPLGLLEITCAQSTASSAGYATGNMVVGVIPALLMISGDQPSPIALMAWIGCVAALGVTLAIPFKRQLINRERLAFPSGTASAVLLHSLHARDTARPRGRAFAAAIGVSALLPILRDALGVVPPRSRLFDWISAGPFRAGDAGVVLDHNLLLVGAGVFVGLRTTLWMVVGGIVTACVIGPLAYSNGSAGAPAQWWAEVGTWLGAPMLVGYAVVALAGRWRAFVATFGRRTQTAADDPANAIEVPRSWFAIGMCVAGASAIVLGQLLFDIPIVLGLLAVALSTVFGAVACRITGETDITPGGPMGKLTQLGFGVLHPHHPPTNLMTAAMTHASSVAAADLLTDLKTGYLLGADPRRQFVAQAIGIAAGAVASVLAYTLLVPDVSTLVGGGDVPTFAAPGAHQFKAIAELMQFGLGRLPTLDQCLVIIGAITGVVLGIGELAAPPRLRRWLPSPAGLGLGLLLPASTSISMAIGAALAAIVARGDRDREQTTIWPLATGALAGESLAGVMIALVNAM